jgi:hypothetical protein
MFDLTVETICMCMCVRMDCVHGLCACMYVCMYVCVCVYASICMRAYDDAQLDN